MIDLGLLETKVDGVSIWYSVIEGNFKIVPHTNLLPKIQVLEACREHYSFLQSVIENKISLSELFKNPPCTTDKYILAPFVSNWVLWVWSKEDDRFRMDYDSDGNDNSDEDNWSNFSWDSDTQKSSDTEIEEDPYLGMTQKNKRFMYI